jgi:hypothetical protein
MFRKTCSNEVLVVPSGINTLKELRFDPEGYYNGLSEDEAIDRFLHDANEAAAYCQLAGVLACVFGCSEQTAAYLIAKCENFLAKREAEQVRCSAEWKAIQRQRRRAARAA